MSADVQEIIHQEEARFGKPPVPARLPQTTRRVPQTTRREPEQPVAKKPRLDQSAELVERMRSDRQVSNVPITIDISDQDRLMQNAINEQTKGIMRTDIVRQLLEIPEDKIISSGQFTKDQAMRDHTDNPDAPVGPPMAPLPSIPEDDELVVDKSKPTVDKRKTADFVIDKDVKRRKVDFEEPSGLGKLDAIDMQKLKKIYQDLQKASTVPIELKDNFSKLPDMTAPPSDMDQADRIRQYIRDMLDAYIQEHGHLPWQAFVENPHAWKDALIQEARLRHNEDLEHYERMLAQEAKLYTRDMKELKKQDKKQEWKEFIDSKRQNEDPALKKRLMEELALPPPRGPSYSLPGDTPLRVSAFRRMQQGPQLVQARPPDMTKQNTILALLNDNFDEVSAQEQLSALGDSLHPEFLRKLIKAHFQDSGMLEYLEKDYQSLTRMTGPDVAPLIADDEKILIDDDEPDEPQMPLLEEAPEMPPLERPVERQRAADAVPLGGRRLRSTTRLREDQPDQPDADPERPWSRSMSVARSKSRVPQSDRPRTRYQTLDDSKVREDEVDQMLLHRGISPSGRYIRGVPSGADIPYYLQGVEGIDDLNAEERHFIAQHHEDDRFHDMLERVVKNKAVAHKISIQHQKHNADPAVDHPPSVTLNEHVENVMKSKPDGENMHAHLSKALKVDAVHKFMPGRPRSEAEEYIKKVLAKASRGPSMVDHHTQAPIQHGLQDSMGDLLTEEIVNEVMNEPEIPTYIEDVEEASRQLTDEQRNTNVALLHAAERNLSAHAVQHSRQSQLMRDPSQAHIPIHHEQDNSHSSAFPAVAGVSGYSDLNKLHEAMRSYKASKDYKAPVGKNLEMRLSQLMAEQDDIRNAVKAMSNRSTTSAEKRYASQIILKHARKTYALIDDFNGNAPNHAISHNDFPKGQPPRSTYETGSRVLVSQNNDHVLGEIVGKTDNGYQVEVSGQTNEYAQDSLILLNVDALHQLPGEGNLVMYNKRLRRVVDAQDGKVTLDDGTRVPADHIEQIIHNQQPLTRIQMSDTMRDFQRIHQRQTKHGYWNHGGILQICNST